MSAPDWREGAGIVKGLLAGERVDDMDRAAVTRAVAYGLIESREQTKACASCGTPKVDYRYWMATPAGRLLAAALDPDQ